ncbi:ABC transporter permease [Pseudonocardia nigra]|uniref:ABC transporter permease n=1 Tax=Pseudonocardia nigra TaxID=1921578 RepID=UPI001C5CDFD9|nr:ABC transporter permease [Pseudonocardia nigra]
MTALVRQRLIVLVPTLLLATLLVFSLLQLVPGDPAIAILGERASAEQLAELREQLGLNDPILVQYWQWLIGVVQGDLGESLYTGEAVVEAIARTLPVTFQLMVAGLILSLLIGVPLGVAAARRANSATDAMITGVSTVGVAVPDFWLGLILVSVFSLTLGWFPATGFVGVATDPLVAVQYLILPAVALGSGGAALVARQLRSALIDSLNADFVRTHRAKGLRTRQIVWQHALKNAALPLATVTGLLVNSFLGATVVIETVFGIPGLGSLVVGATLQRDFPVIQGVVLTMVVLVVVTNLLVDISYRLIDPRTR